MATRKQPENQITVNLTQDRVTAGAVRFAAAEDDKGRVAVDNVYIRKFGFPAGDLPENVTVTVTWE